MGAARADVVEGRLLPVPVHLRDRHYGGAQRLGHGDGYEYAHDAEGGVAAQDYLGVDKTYYHPVPRGFEAELRTGLRPFAPNFGKRRISGPLVRRRQTRIRSAPRCRHAGKRLP
ncbi:MAG: hypothetical protein QM775_04605 [Pirellulales bacterium]